MSGAFACPECGTPIERPAHAPGTRLRCPECSTLVEMPFLERKVRRRRRLLLRGWLGVAIALALGLGLGLMAFDQAARRVRRERRSAFAQQLKGADAAERDGRLDEAIERLEAALRVAAGEGAAAPSERDEVAARRARLADERDRRAAAARRAEASAALDEAAGLLGGGPPAEAFYDLCDRAARAVAPLGDADPEATALRRRAEALVGRVVATRGVRFEPIAGRFVYGPQDSEAHAASLHTMLAGALRARGFVPRRDGSPLAGVWDRAAPFLVATTIEEEPAGTYEASVLRTFRMTAHLELRAGSTVLWSAEPKARTRQPARLPARLSGLLAVKRTGDPQLERHLWRDAQDALAERLSVLLPTMPTWTPALVPGTRTGGGSRE